jgi:hypothetical protein
MVVAVTGGGGVTTMAMKVPYLISLLAANEFVRTPFVDRVCHEQ